MAQSANVVVVKSYSFALRVVKLYKFLVESKKEFVLSKQVLRSGTSIGANIEEAVGSQSRKEFRAKMSVAYKEVRETRFWINLLRDSLYLDNILSKSLLDDCDELAKIIGKILITTTRTLNDSDH